ncbi:hypothetical protein EZV62_027138 [Acer yangbiense]|uniref:R13L1/DRL21-like LRR repeat region domain-containing protein n=1 Tax=Acer yangbiense TaxID=1000413 RepID=A0A5C7GSU5_9ROSI|nr:hypothetical protein EZV62_027138 [Acer yangbiense]
MEGELHIENLHRVTNQMDAKEANLVGKRNLRGLSLSWAFGGGFSLQYVNIKNNKSIIESATGTACEALDLDPLQERLQGILNGKRYLLVLDDVCNIF